MMVKLLPAKTKIEKNGKSVRNTNGKQKPTCYHYCTIVSIAVVFLTRIVEDSKESRRGLLSNTPQVVKVDANALLPVEISRNENATLAGDILSISHLPEHSRVDVKLRAGARCPRPFLIGRLSGPALVELEWTWINNSVDETSIMEGTYKANMPGQYFLEIVAVFCDDFFYDLSNIDDGADRPINTTEQSAMEVNFKGTCVEDSSHQRITAINASIWVNEAASAFGERSRQNLQGYWQRSSDYSADAIQPLFTRHQPHACVRNSSAPCQVVTEVERFQPYDFKWSTPYTHLHNTTSLAQETQTTVCFLGYSHSRKLWLAAEQLNLTLANRKINVSTGWIRGKFPWQVKGEVYEPLVQGCHKLVVAVGQWPASEKRGSPTLLSTYYNQTRKMFSSLKASKNITSQMEIYARPIHYNPLGFLQTICPPQNWRSPLVIDGYNKVIKRVCAELDVPYIDVNFVLAPLWDHASDWCHLDSKVQTAELMYILASVLGVIGDDSSKKTNILTGAMLK